MLPDGNFKLQFLFPQDASGILYKVTTALFAYGWDILSAYSRPNEDAEVEDVFIMTSTRHEALTKTACDQILAAVKELVVERPDRPKVLMQITQALYALGLDIIAFSAEAVYQGVRDEFLVHHADRAEISEKDRLFLSDLLNQKLTF